MLPAVPRITVSRQDRTAVLGGILPIFSSFLADFLPMVPHPLFFHPHVYKFCLFPPVSANFLPIFCLKWYPILFINSSMVPHLPFPPPTCLRILPIFRLTFHSFSAGPVLTVSFLFICMCQDLFISTPAIAAYERLYRRSLFLI